MTASHHRKHVEHCLNCGFPTPGEFCERCGQEAVDAAVTFRDQIAHFFEEVFGVESRLPQTARLLFTKPGELTRAYNSGQRVRFVTPLKLYLFASVAFFLALSLSTSNTKTHLITVKHSASGETAAVSTGAADSDPAFQTAEEFDKWRSTPANYGKIPAFLQPHLRSLLASPDGIIGPLIDMLSKASMALVPIHALLLKLLYWRPRRLYGEHIVFSLHLHSFAYLAFALSMIVGVVSSKGVSAVANESISSTADTIAVVGGAAYSVVAAKTAYGQGLVRSALKMSAVAVGYGFALLGVLMLAAGWAFFQI